MTARPPVPADVLEGGPLKLGARDHAAPKRRVFAPLSPEEQERRRPFYSPETLVSGRDEPIAHIGPPPRLLAQKAIVVPLRPADYTPGAGGALTGVESALSSLPSCPCVGSATVDGPSVDVKYCGKPARPIGGPLLRCTAGHVFAGTAAEHEQARGALAAARRRASPLAAAERATRRERLRAEVDGKTGGEER